MIGLMVFCHEGAVLLGVIALGNEVFIEVLRKDMMLLRAFCHGGHLGWVIVFKDLGLG